MRSIFNLIVMITLGAAPALALNSSVSSAPRNLKVGHYHWESNLKLSVPYRIETLDLRTVAGADRLKELKANGSVCEILQSTGRCRIAGGTLSAAQVARATTLAHDILKRNFGTGSPLVVLAEPTAVRLVTQAPQLTHYEINQKGQVGGRDFEQVSAFITADGIQKFQILQNYWLKLEATSGTLVHGFTLQLQEKGPSSQVSWVVLAEAALLNTFE